MNGETKPVKGFAVLNFPTDLLVTLMSNGEVVTQTIPDYAHSKASLANMYMNDEDKLAEDQVDNVDNVSPHKCVLKKQQFENFESCKV